MGEDNDISFDMEIAQRVCDAIAETAKGLTHILAIDEDFPDRKKWFCWLNGSEDLRNRYARAKELQAELLFEECMEISDDDSEDRTEVDECQEPQAHGGSLKRSSKQNSEFVQRSRLRIDTRKWMLGKLNPKKYGEKITQQHTGPDGGPIDHKWTVEYVNPTPAADAAPEGKS